jgi:predicted O-linked N-acetylglucosamine transferase (SPINDLY family)
MRSERTAEREGLDAAVAGRWDEALLEFRRPADFLDASAPHLNNLGVAYFGCKRYGRAAACFRRAWRMEKRPYLSAHLARAFWLAGERARAIEAWQEALDLEPGNAGWRRLLAAALAQSGRAEEAVANARWLIDVDPDDAADYLLLGDCLRKSGRTYEAIDAYETAVKRTPDDGAAWNNLGGALLLIGETAAAMASFRSAEEITGDPAIGSNALLAMQYDGSVSPEQVALEHRKWAERHWPDRPSLGCICPPAASGRLRVGYVSGDFREHSAAFLIEPVLAAHDRAAVEVFLYSTVGSEDAGTRRIRALDVHWREVAGLTDDAACQAIRDDGIDVLIDLSGHTSGNRLGIFAQRPVAIQATYCGYPGTTGMAQIDYRITDAWCDPPGTTEHLHSERLIRLEEGFICYRPPEYAPEVGAAPVLRNGYVTFGCLAGRQKVSDEMLRLWAQVLRAVPDSVLVLKWKGSIERRAQEHVFGVFAEMGVDAERICLLGHSQRPEHILVHNEIDILLDTYPYHGTIGTLEALWMGVPVITLAGRTHVSRVGVSLLARAGLDDWITATPEEYAERAIRAAKEVSLLDGIRTGLRRKLESSSLIDATRIARRIEAAFRQAITARLQPR